MRALVVGLLFGLHASNLALASEFMLIPEQEPLQGIVYAPPSLRAALAQMDSASEALSIFSLKIKQVWPQIQEISFENLSRFQVEETKNYHLPALPLLEDSKIVGADLAHETLFLEIRGPRLPAKYDIIYRYVFFYSSYHLKTRQLGPMTITIRGWVLE